MNDWMGIDEEVARRAERKAIIAGDRDRWDYADFVTTDAERRARAFKRCVVGVFFAVATLIVGVYMVAWIVERIGGGA